jgi:hypothetical protein
MALPQRLGAPEVRSGSVATNDGVRLYYEEAGAGPPVVLVHGAGCSLRWWSRNFTALAARFRVVALGLGRIVALHRRSSTSYQIHEHIRCLYC